jgi:phage portal protein BeeE
MSERRRFPFFRRRGVDQADVNRLNDLLDETRNASVNVWDGKTLASLSKIGTTTNGRQKSGGFDPAISYDLLRAISLKSEVVNAILRCTVNDTIGNGYEFVLKEGLDEGSQAGLERLKQFFENPNPDDSGDEWLESLIYDLQLFGDAYLELDGSGDRSTNNGEDWTFGGDLVAVWTVPAEQIKIIPANQRPEPPKMAYIQKIDKATRRFSADKILHVSKFKHGRAYGTSPLIPILNTIAAHLNLSNYLGELYTGTLPKTILNVGDISNSEMKAMLALLEQQLAGGKSPFGLVAVNGGTGFDIHRLLDSTREGAQLDLLFYYREEICAVFGIPPIKLGWVQTGKLANPESQLDAWYDVIESFQNRVEALINRRIIPLLGVTDWEFRFQSIRPSRERELAEVFKEQANAISNLRQEGALSINEARTFLGLERIEDNRADDPFFISPKLQINQPDALSGQTPPTAPESAGLSDLFPEKARPTDEGEGAGEIPAYVPDKVNNTEVNTDAKILIGGRRKDGHDEFEALIQTDAAKYEANANAEQASFADDVLSRFDSLFADGDEAVVLPDVELRTYRRKATISLDDIQSAVLELDTAIEQSIERHIISGSLVLTDAYGESLVLTLGGSGIATGLNAPDEAALAYWRRRWQLPALRNTLGAHRRSVLSVFEKMLEDGQSWRWAKGQMRSLIEPTGSRYPAYFYERIARTETRRVVENAHINGLKRANFSYVERLVTVDDRTDSDLCLPFENAIYPIDEARSVIPAHPNCRCTFVAAEGEPENVLPAEDILRPDVEGAES